MNYVALRSKKVTRNITAVLDNPAVQVANTKITNLLVRGDEMFGKEVTNFSV
ncbi:MAG: hypothetical protein ACPGLY_17055 [Rubripirellula sp.]